jgi:concanavalin A-like lectin/glucanase superfamily protein/putative Ig domain-containing protein/List-Bact-rpt repeat protein
MLKYAYDAGGNIASQAEGNLLLPQIIGQPVKRVVEPGQVATFSVVVVDASGATFQWKFNGADIPGATGDSLLLTNVSAASAGQYSVVVTNGAGSLTSAPAALTVGKNGDASDASPPLKLVAYSDAGGSVTVAPMKLGYDLGETVTLTATPAPASAFIGWAGDLNVGDLISPTNPVSFAMTGNKTVRARFASALLLPAGMVAFWRGETDANDLIGGHDGDFFAGTSTAAPCVTRFGKVGGAFTFDGTVHVRVPHSNELTPAQMTAEAWIFPTVQSGDHQTVFARGSPTNEDDAWWLGVFNGNPRFWSKHIGSGELLLEAPSTIPLNSWTHLAISFDGSTKRLYVNGVQVASQMGLGALIYEPAPVPVTIGSDWGFNASSARFTGLVDEVALYDRALSLNEVFDIYNADFIGKDVTRPYFTSPSPLPDVAPGASYSQQLATVLGAAPISFSLSAGALPPGMTLSSAGLVSGISNTSGIFDFTVLATDAAGKSTEQLYVLRILTPVTLPADMIAWWRGEPASDGTVVDTLGGHGGSFFSGNSPTSASYTPDGTVGSAFAFDGTVYVQVPDADQLRPAEMTAEAWVFPILQSGNHQAIIARGSSTNDDDAWWMGVLNGGPRFWSKHAGAGMVLLEAPAAIPLKAWTHLAITFDGATKGLYVNGVQVASQGVPGVLIYEPAPSPPALPPPVTIGADWGRNAPVDIFTGRVDEVSLYRRGLSSDEIFSIADAGAAGKRTTGPYINSPSQLPDAIVGQAFSHKFTSILGAAPVGFALSTSSTLPPALTLDSTGVLSGVPANAGRFAFVVHASDAAGLFAEQRCALRAFESILVPAAAVGWWRAEGNAQDSVGANHGALRNGAGFSPGKVGQAFSLDGSTGSVEIPDAPALRPVSLTLEAWVAFDTITGIRVVFAKPVGSGTSDSYALWLQGANLMGAVGDAAAIGPILPAAFSPAPGRWYHVAYTFDDAAKQQALYIDGQQVAVGAASKSIGYDGQPLLLGRDTENGAPNFFLQGSIDEAAVYNRVLSGAEIAAVYNAGAAGKHL